MLARRLLQSIKRKTGGFSPFATALYASATSTTNYSIVKVSVSAGSVNFSTVSIPGLTRWLTGLPVRTKAGNIAILGRDFTLPVIAQSTDVDLSVDGPRLPTTCVQWRQDKLDLILPEDFSNGATNVPFKTRGPLHVVKNDSATMGSYVLTDTGISSSPSSSADISGVFKSITGAYGAYVFGVGTGTYGGYVGIVATQMHGQGMDIPLYCDETILGATPTFSGWPGSNSFSVPDYSGTFGGPYPYENSTGSTVEYAPVASGFVRSDRTVAPQKFSAIFSTKCVGYDPSGQIFGVRDFFSGEFYIITATGAGASGHIGDNVGDSYYFWPASTGIYAGLAANTPADAITQTAGTTSPNITYSALTSKLLTSSSLTWAWSLSNPPISVPFDPTPLFAHAASNDVLGRAINTTASTAPTLIGIRKGIAYFYHSFTVLEEWLVSATSIGIAEASTTWNGSTWKRFGIRSETRTVRAIVAVDVIAGTVTVSPFYTQLQVKNYYCNQQLDGSGNGTGLLCNPSTPGASWTKSQIGATVTTTTGTLMAPHDIVTVDNTEYAVDMVAWMRIGLDASNPVAMTNPVPAGWSGLYDYGVIPHHGALLVANAASGYISTDLGATWSAVSIGSAPWAAPTAATRVSMGSPLFRY